MAGLDPKLKKKIDEFVNADVSAEIAKKYGTKAPTGPGEGFANVPVTSPPPAPATDPNALAGFDSYMAPKGAPAAALPTAPTAGFANVPVTKQPVNADSLGLPTAANPQPSSSPLTGVDQYMASKGIAPVPGAQPGYDPGTGAGFMAKGAQKPIPGEGYFSNGVYKHPDGTPYPPDQQPYAPGTAPVLPAAKPAASPVAIGGGPPKFAGQPSAIAQKAVDPFKYMSPGEKSEMAHTLDFMRKTGQIDQAILDADAEGKHHIANTLKNYQDEAENEQAAFEEKQKAFKETFANDMSKYESLMNDAANTKIDAGNWFASKDTAGQIATSIGILLGGLAAGRNHGTNQVMEFINKQIDRDIDTQKANLGSKYSALAAQKGLYAMHRDAFGDEQTAYYASKAAYAEQVQRQIQAVMASTDSELAKLNGEKALVQLDGQINQYKDNVIKLNEQRAMAAANAAAAARAAEMKKIEARNEKIFESAVGNANTFATEYTKKTGKQASVQLIADGPQKGMPVVVDETGAPIPGFSGAGGTTAKVVTGVNAKGEAKWGDAPADSKEAAAKLSAASQKYSQLKQDIALLRKYHENAGEIYDTAAEKANVAAAVARIKLNMKDFTNLGRLSTEGVKLLEDMTPNDKEVLNSPWLTSDAGKAKIESLDKYLDESYSSMKASGGAGAPDTLDLGAPVKSGGAKPEEE